MTDVRELIERLREMAPEDGKAIRCAGRTTAMMNTDIHAAATALTAALEREEVLREALRTAQDHVCMAYCHFDDETREASAHQPVCDKLRTALENTNGN